MKITYEDLKGNKVIIEEQFDYCDIDDMQDVLERLLLGIGYHPNNINDLFGKRNQDDI